MTLFEEKTPTGAWDQRHAPRADVLHEEDLARPELKLRCMRDAKYASIAYRAPDDTEREATVVRVEASLEGLVDSKRDVGVRNCLVFGLENVR